MPKRNAKETDGKPEDSSNRDTPDQGPPPAEDEKPNIWMGCGLPAAISAFLLVALAFWLAS